MGNGIDGQGSPQRWIFFLLIAGLIAITILYLTSRLFRYSDSFIFDNPYVSSTELKQFALPGVQVAVPLNMVRF